jgi:hypothetical protein
VRTTDSLWSRLSKGGEIAGDNLVRLALLVFGCLPAFGLTGAWPAPTYTYDGSTWTPGGSTT